MLCRRDWVRPYKLVIVSLLFALGCLYTSQKIERFSEALLMYRYHNSVFLSCEHSPPHTRPPNTNSYPNFSTFGQAESDLSKEVGRKLEVYQHIVTPGESGYKLSRKYGVTVDTIKAANPKIKDWWRDLKPGDILKIPSVNGIFHQVQPKDSLIKLAKKYKIKPQDVLLVLANGSAIAINEPLKPGINLFLLGAKPKNIVTLLYTTAQFILPVKGRIVSRFGLREHPLGGGNPGEEKLRFHGGIDIAASYGTPFVASANGKITYAGWYGDLGYTIFLKHNKTYTTVYGHAASLLVHTGQYVAKGQVIGRVGCSGRATGPHLHFEIRKNGLRVNPVKLLFRH